MCCRQCGAQIPNEAWFCSKCGVECDIKGKDENNVIVIEATTGNAKNKFPLFLLIVAGLLIISMTFFPVFELRLSYEDTSSVGKVGKSTMLETDVANLTIPGFDVIMSISKMTYLVMSVITISTIIFSYYRKDSFAWASSFLYFPCLIIYIGSLLNQFNHIDKYSIFEADGGIAILLITLCSVVINSYCFTLMVITGIRNRIRPIV